MSASETFAEWIESFRRNEAYAEAEHLRREIVSRVKAAGGTWDALTPETITPALQAWIDATRGDWNGLPELPEEDAAKAAPVVKEWLEYFNDGKRPLALLSVEDFMGAIEAVRCGLKGIPLEVSTDPEPSPDGAPRASFNLTPKG